MTHRTLDYGPRNFPFNFTVGFKITELKSPDICLRLERQIVNLFFLCLSCMKKSYNLYLNTRSSKAPAVPLTFEARWNSLVLLGHHMKRSKVIRPHMAPHAVQLNEVT
jgi:hypothetical protein